MTAVGVLGWVAAAVGSMLAVPQLWHILSTRRTAGLSLLAWDVTVAAGVAWTVHGTRVERANLYVPNAILMCLSAAVTVLILVHRRSGGAAVGSVGLVAVVAAACIAVDVLAGAAPFGAAVVIPQLVAAASQLLDMVRSVDLAGVSETFLWFNVVVQSLWLWWGVWAGEHAVVVAATLTALAWAVNGVYHRGRALGWWSARVGDGPQPEREGGAA